MKDFFREGKPLHFVFPIDGDCLNAHDGTLTENGLEITAAVSAPRGRNVKINGCAAEFDGQDYICTVRLNKSRAGLCKTVLFGVGRQGRLRLHSRIRRVENAGRLSHLVRRQHTVSP